MMNTSVASPRQLTKDLERTTSPERMSSQEPLVTIGVPVYNGEAMLGDMLVSLEAQTFKRFKVVICDNASTDRTPEIAQAFCARDPRFTYHRNPENIGAAPNFNRVFELGHTTPYFKWAPHDDLYAPTWLERCVELLEQDPTATIAWSVVTVRDEVGDGRALDHASYGRGVEASYRDDQGRQCWTMGPRHLAEGDDPARRLSEKLNRMIGCFAFLGLIRTEALLRTNLHRSYDGADRSLLAELVLLGRCRQVPEPLYINRYHKTAGRSLSVEQRQIWTDSKGEAANPQRRQFLDILKAPAVVGLPPLTRARCLAVILHHFARRSAGKLVRRLRPAARPPARTGDAAA
jgi:glycosyltransferase involved in cell wall biosynthesis